MNLNSVKHVRLGGGRATNNRGNYFPNATELTIEFNLKTNGDSIPKILNQIVHLKNLKKLIIGSDRFPFEHIVELIRYTSNLHTLKINLSSSVAINLDLIYQSQTYQYVSNTNKIKYLDIHGDCSSERIQFIVCLFPKIEYFKTGVKKEEINHIVRFLVIKNMRQSSRLFFLCMSEIPKRCLKELNMLIKSENLLDDYYLKFVNRDLYVWWS
jgi:hypothetical protein